MDYVVNEPVKHGGKRYEPQAVLSANAKQAEALLAANVISESPSVKARADADAKAKAKADADAKAKADADEKAKPDAARKTGGEGAST